MAVLKAVENDFLLPFFSSVQMKSPCFTAFFPFGLEFERKMGHQCDGVQYWAVVAQMLKEICSFFYFYNLIAFLLYLKSVLYFSSSSTILTKQNANQASGHPGILTLNNLLITVPKFQP